MNPVALVVNLDKVKVGSMIIVNENSFDEKNFERAKLEKKLLELKEMNKFDVHSIKMTDQTLATEETTFSNTDKARKNFFALGMISWLLSRPIKETEKLATREIR